MTLMFWGRGLLLGGLLAALLSAAPVLLLAWLPPAYGEGFVGSVALLLSLSVTPLALVIASVGAILLLAAVVRRGRP